MDDRSAATAFVNPRPFPDAAGTGFLYVSVNIISPGCENIQAMIDAIKAARTETAHFVWVSEIIFAGMVFKNEYSIPAKTSKDTCFPNVYGTCFASMAHSPTWKLAHGPSSRIICGKAVSKPLFAKAGSVTIRIRVDSIGHSNIAATAPAATEANK